MPLNCCSEVLLCLFRSEIIPKKDPGVNFNGHEKVS